MSAMELSSASAMDEVTSVRCRFVTSVAEIRVPTDALSLPVRLGRKGLSELLNQLIGGRAAGSTYEFLVFDNTGAAAANCLLRCERCHGQGWGRRRWRG